MSSVVRRSEVIPVNGRLIAGPGNFFFLFSSAVNVSVAFERGGTTFGGDSVPAGYVKRNVLEWNRLTITGAAGTALVFYYGTELIAEDDTDIRTSIATLAGVTAVAEAAAAAVTDQAPVVVVTATEAALFAANLARRRIAVHVDSTNVGSCFARPAGASVNNVAELQPGVVYTFAGTYGLDVRNDTGANATFYLFEES